MIRKDKRATKRDLKEWIEENYGSYEYWDSSWKLTRHPYSKKKHLFGSPKHMNRLVARKDKQMKQILLSLNSLMTIYVRSKK